MPKEPQWQRSQVVPVFVPGAQWMRTWLPDWVAAQVDLDGREPSLPAPQAAPETEPALPAPVSEA